MVEDSLMDMAEEVLFEHSRHMVEEQNKIDMLEQLVVELVEFVVDMEDMVLVGVVLDRMLGTAQVLLFADMMDMVVVESILHKFESLDLFVFSTIL